MNDKERELFTLLWDLVNKHHRLLSDVLPLIQEVVVTLEKGQPSPVELSAWLARYKSFDQGLHSLTASFEELIRTADPSLIRYDA